MTITNRRLPADTEGLQKLLLSWALLVTAAEIFIILQFRNGYQISVYRQLPIAFLAFGVFVTVSGTALSLWFLLRQQHQTALVALLPVIMQVMLVMILPYLLGYEIAAGDMLTHAGDIRTIQFYDRIISAPRAHFSNQYRPMFHLLVIVLSDVTGSFLLFDESFIVFGVVDLFSALVFLLLTSAFCRSCGFSGVYGIFGALLVIFSGVAPSNVAYETLFVLGLFLLARVTAVSESRRYLLLFVLVTVALWPFHQLPPVTLVVVSWLGLVLHLPWLREALPRFGFVPNRRLSGILLLVPFLVSVPGYLWWTYAPYFRMSVTRVFGLSATGGNAATQQASVLFDEFGFSLFEFGLLVAKVQGPTMLLLLLGGLGGLLVFLPQRWVATPRVPPMLFFIFAIAGVWTPLEFVGSGLGLGYSRALLIVELIIPLFVGVFLFVALRWIRRVRYEHLLMAGTVFLLISSSLTAGLLLHEARLQSSPWRASSNNYIVESELDGWNWYFESKSADYGTLTLGRRPDRFVDFHLTARERVRRSDNIRYATGERRTTVPPHFGNTTLGSQFGDAYYIDTAVVRLNRLEVHPEWDVFIHEDFDRLQMDPTANRIYQNGNVNVYRVVNITKD